jgi:hypothetical protein
MNGKRGRLKRSCRCPSSPRTRGEDHDRGGAERRVAADQIVSEFYENAEIIYLFVFMQFLTENRCALLPELL